MEFFKKVRCTLCKVQRGQSQWSQGNLQLLTHTVVEKTNRPSPVFHTKLAFLRAILGTKALKNCLVLLRNNQNVQDEHNLYFWLKNIHEFQNGSIPFSLFHLLLSKNSKNMKQWEGNAAILKLVNIFEPNLQIMFFLYKMTAWIIKILGVKGATKSLLKSKGLKVQIKTIS